PKQQVANWEAPVHGREEITHLRVLPDEGPLYVRKANFPKFNEFDKGAQIVSDFLVNGPRHDQSLKTSTQLPVWAFTPPPPRHSEAAGSPRPCGSDRGRLPGSQQSPLR